MRGERTYGSGNIREEKERKREKVKREGRVERGIREKRE